MAKDFVKIAEGVLEGVGGKDNVKSVVHCATRLRFTLKDSSSANDEALKNLSGVVSVVKAAGLYQVVIGNDVHEVFLELEKLGAPTGGGAAVENSGGGGPITLASLGNSLIGTISGVFTPILAALMGIGLIKGIIAILEISFPLWATSGDTSHTIIVAAGDTLMYFLPILIAYTSSVRFGLDPILGMIIGGALVYPSITELYPFGPWGTHKFLGIDNALVMMRYSGTVLPSIFAVYGASYLYKWLRKVLPSSVKNFLGPFFTLIIIIPLTFLIIGPIFGVVGLGIQNGIRGIVLVQFVGPILLGLIIGGFWQVLVIFGLHWALVPVGIAEATVENELFALNRVSYIFAYNQIAVIAQVGAIFAMAVRIKNTERRSAALAAGIGGIFGITEPIIYGFTLPKKKPFFTACCCGAFAGALGALAGNFVSEGHGIAAQMGAMGIFQYPSYLLPGFSGSTANLLIALGASLLSAGATFAIVYATYKPDEAESKTVEAVVIDTSKVNTETAKKIFSPLKGRVLPITQSADPVHQQEGVGKGVCFMPLGGKIFAPFDGTVDMVFDTKHAIGFISKDGVELLIHCGIDTVKLGGRGFTTHVKEGDAVKAGDLVLEYDKDIIARAGYSLETQVVVSNFGDYKAITQAKNGECAVGDLIIYVE
ncbi:MAG: beta-glucoside-specific PTS transporter subunit IIABC [Termitinemataceae bacterium]|nr:MAG: beta-glucoside-specific PTS transporter subunit IIABC [Termitinemataceae bacterium]